MKPATMPPSKAPRTPPAPPGRGAGGLPPAADDAAFDQALRMHARHGGQGASGDLRTAAGGAAGAQARTIAGTPADAKSVPEEGARLHDTAGADEVSAGMTFGMMDEMAPRADDPATATATITLLPAATPPVRQGEARQQAGQPAATREMADRGVAARLRKASAAWSGQQVAADQRGIPATAGPAAPPDDAISTNDAHMRGDGAVRDAVRARRGVAVAGHEPAGLPAALRPRRMAASDGDVARNTRHPSSTEGEDHQADAADAHALRKPGRARGRTGLHLSESAVPLRQEVQVLSSTRQAFLPPSQHGMAGLSGVAVATPATLFGVASDAAWGGAAGQVLKALRENVLPGMADGAGGAGRISGAKTLRRLQIQLHPASLGTVTAQLALVDGRMEITLRVPDRRLVEHLRPGLDGLLQRLRGPEDAARANVQLVVDPSLTSGPQERSAMQPHGAHSGSWQGTSGGPAQQGAGQTAGHAAGGDGGRDAGMGRGSGSGTHDPQATGTTGDEGAGETDGAVAGAVYL